MTTNLNIENFATPYLQANLRPPSTDYITINLPLSLTFEREDKQQGVGLQCSTLIASELKLYQCQKILSRYVFFGHDMPVTFLGIIHGDNSVDNSYLFPQEVKLASRRSCSIFGWRVSCCYIALKVLSLIPSTWDVLLCDRFC